MLHGAVTGDKERVLLQCSDERLPGKADRAASRHKTFQDSIPFGPFGRVVALRLYPLARVMSDLRWSWGAGGLSSVQCFCR